MSKVTAGVLAGIVLGALHGVWSAWGDPKAMDVFTQSPVTQSDELDYTLHNPVTIAPIQIP